MAGKQTSTPGKELDLAPTAGAGVPKNFRTHPDIESFYRFIHENDLREEGLEILNTVLIKKAEKKLAKKSSN